MPRAAVALLLTLAACTRPAASADPAPPLDTSAVSWMAGEWVNATVKGSSRETWTVLNRKKMVGVSRQLRGGKEVFSEQLQIVVTNGTLQYRASPQGQAPHTFVLAAHGPNWVRFEDPDHDWPQRIEYRRVRSTLEATVSGTGEGGEERVESFVWGLAPPTND